MSYKPPFLKPLRPVQRAWLLASLCCLATCSTPARVPPQTVGTTAAAGPPAPALSTVRWLAALINRPAAAPPDPSIPAAGSTAGLDAVAPNTAAGTPLAPFSIVEYGPQEQAGVPDEIFVRFSAPVVALGQATDPDRGSAVREANSLPRIEISPALPGRAYFQTPERLVFVFDHNPAPATRYTVKLRPPQAPSDPARWSALKQPADGAALTWAFETTRPSVEGFGPSDSSEPRSRTAQVVIETTQRVNPARVAPLVRAQVVVAGKLGAIVPVRVDPATEADLRQAEFYRRLGPSEAGFFLRVRPQTVWPIGAKIRLSLPAGWLGEEGPLPAATPWEMEFRTLPALRLLGSTCTAEKPCAQEPVRLRFNNEIPYAEVKGIEVTPKPEWVNVTTWGNYHPAGSSSAVDESEEEGHALEIEGAFLPGRRYRIRIAGELRDVYEQRLGKPVEVTAVFAPRTFLGLSNERGILRRSTAQTVGVTARHLQTIEVRAQILDDEQALRLLVGSPGKKPAAAAVDDSEDEPTLPAPKPQFVQQVTLKPRGPTDWSSVAIDLAKLTAGGSGAVLVEVVGTGLAPGRASLPLPRPVRGLYRLTDLGPVLTSSRPRSVLTVHRLADGGPVAGAEVSRIVASGTRTVLGRTDAHGVLSVAPADDRDFALHRALFVVEAGDSPGPRDRAYLTIPQDGRERDDNADGAQVALRRGERLLAQVITERDAYRPGETVRCVGFSAIESPYVRSSLRRTPADANVVLTLRDYRKQTVAQRRVKTTAEGKFFAELPLPAEAALGSYHLDAELLGSSHGTRVKVEDYRTPEYSVSASPDRDEVIFPARPQIRVAATYFFGGEVPLLRASAHQSCSPTRYRPPQLDSEWQTGAPILDGRSDSKFVDVLASQGAADAARARGRATFTAPESGPHNDPRRCTVSVSLADASQQSIGAETSYLVHPAPYYLAVRTPSTMLYAGGELNYALRALAPDGRRVAAAAVRVQAERRYYETLYRQVGKERVFDRIEERSESAPGCTVSLTASGPDVSCRIGALKSGRYVLRVTGGPEASTARAETTVYVYEKSREPKTLPAPPPPPPRLALWLSQDLAQPGDVLSAQISAPWPISGVLVIARKGVREHLPFSITAASGGRVPLSLPVDDSWVPSVHLRVIGVRPPKDGDHRPEVENAQQIVRVDHAHRRLHVQVEAPPETGPGTRVPIVVRVRDSGNQRLAEAAQARIALWAVDEAVLSLTNYQVPDPLPSFIPQTDNGLHSRDEYSAILPPYSIEEDDPWLLQHLSGLTGYGSGHGGAVHDSFANGGIGMVPAARQRFETTPVFLGDVALGRDGEARIDAQLPDNLTTFRITAVASARLVDSESPGRFGLGDTRLRVSQPFLVRAALPRLLREGDKATLGALLTNRSGPAGHAEVRMEVHQDSNNPVLTLLSPDRLAQPLPAGELLRLPFVVTARRAGTVEIELTATLRPPPSGPPGTTPSPAPLADRLRLPFTVQRVAPRSERFALYGTLDDSQPVALPLALPAAIRRDQGGLSVRTSPSLLRDLDGAAQSLIEYPYGCVEQTSSRLLPLVALGDITRLLPPTATSPQENTGGSADKPALVARYIEAGIERLATMQTTSGGFAYWPGGVSPNIYASAYATWVLQLVAATKPAISEVHQRRLADLLQRSGDYLLKTFVPPERDGGVALLNAASGSMDVVRAMMAAQVLAEGGRAPASFLSALYEQRANTPVFARALLLLAMHRAAPDDPRVASLRHELLGAVGELSGSAHVKERMLYRMDSLFHSDTRSDAMVLLALLRTQPDHPLVTKLTRGLLDRRRAGGWRNTQENAYALLALAAYGRAFESVEPQLQVQAWLGRDLIPGGSLSYTRRSADPVELRLPMPALLSTPQGDPGPLILARQGSGRLYYRIELSMTPEGPAAEQEARSQDLRISRSLRTARSPQTQEVLLGEPTAIDLQLANRADLSYVAVEVPLPAGLEVLQKNIGRGQASLRISGHADPYVSHEELRADRVLLFADYLPAGTHHHTIYVRPTTAGTFVLPAAHAEAMYEPEIHGRTTGATVVVK
ncbi:MAG TPA: alpha-2-macroglobulin family protein [Pseudomonadota bacterium]|nr:alpha-2-macroglobulin family protein [Pseudomonadota bacterium]